MKKGNHSIKSTKTKKVIIIVLFLNLSVLLIELFCGIFAKSLSILGDAAHSASDTLNNIVGLVILSYASKPADEEHPYGHGKFETIAAFGMVAFLAVASVEIIRGSLERLFHPVELPLFSQGVTWLLLFTLVLNLLVWFYERKEGLKLKSNFLIADSSHTGSDILVKLSVIASQFFIAKKMYWVDPVLAIIIALIIIKAGYEIAKNTLPILVDERWISTDKISKSILSIKGVTDCYDIYSRKSPDSAFIECKIKVAPSDIKTAHKITDTIEDKLKKDFGKCVVTIHIEP